mmetsp:Transcript_356/g.1139  ORF Transcript_356/g.1139 Transcript_356/m.1139 type:complete len:309 (+) Transcript_356:542-1468(+)
MAGCRITVMIRVREPLSWYRSFYSWKVIGEKQTTLERRGLATARSRYGNNMSDWLPHNLQTRILLEGSPDAGGPSYLRRAGAPRLDNDERASLYKLLADPQHIVFPLDELDAALTVVSMVTGFITPGYTYARPRYRMGASSDAAAANAATRVSRRIGEVDTSNSRLLSLLDVGNEATDPCIVHGVGTPKACYEAVMSHAPDDVWLYREASRLFAERRRQLETMRILGERLAAQSEIKAALATEQVMAELPPGPPLQRHACRKLMDSGSLQSRQCGDKELRYEVLPSLARKKIHGGRRRERARRRPNEL